MLMMLAGLGFSGKGPQLTLMMLAGLGFSGKGRPS